MRRSQAWIVSAVVVLALAGCTAEEPPPPPVLTEGQIKELAAQQEAMGHVAQGEAMADGRVTRDEYLSAFEDLTECITGLGLPQPQTWTSPIDGQTLLFDLTSGAAASDATRQSAESCSNEAWNPISSVYQDTAPVQMDEPLRLQAIECIRDGGYQMQGDERSPSQMAGPDAMGPSGPSERWNVVAECLEIAQFELFPEIPVAAITLK